MGRLPGLRICLCLLGLAWSLAARAEVCIIVNPENPVHAMTPREVSDLYLGRTRSFDPGEGRPSWPASIYDQVDGSPLRETFFRALNGMDIRRLNAYWARLRFSGEVLPPKALPDGKAVLDAVRRDRNGIGYVHSSEIDDSVRIVLRLKE
ncbi:hypothetical protein RHDC4_02628 [Rhodocyclaceae bacterium]|nr:hypothetical protein RHDC4_02628 [Rhodocyclaceae bacterium]